MKLKIQNLKEKLLWDYCSELLKPALPYLEPLKLRKEDNEIEKKRKQQEHLARIQQRELIKKTREPELMRAFNKCIERVRKSREDKLINDNSINAFSYNNSVIPMSMTCSLCTNRDPQYFVVDFKSGDTICSGTDKRR